jgi:hypothetical protein
MYSLVSDNALFMRMKPTSAKGKEAAEYIRSESFRQSGCARFLVGVEVCALRELLEVLMCAC